MKVNINIYLGKKRVGAPEIVRGSFLPCAFEHFTVHNRIDSLQYFSSELSSGYTLPLRQPADNCGKRVESTTCHSFMPTAPTFMFSKCYQLSYHEIKYMPDCLRVVPLLNLFLQSCLNSWSCHGKASNHSFLHSRCSSSMPFDHDWSDFSIDMGHERKVAVEKLYMRRRSSIKTLTRNSKIDGIDWVLEKSV